MGLQKTFTDDRDDTYTDAYWRLVGFYWDGDALAVRLCAWVTKADVAKPRKRRGDVSIRFTTQESNYVLNGRVEDGASVDAKKLIYRKVKTHVPVDAEFDFRDAADVLEPGQ
jgi:hypothetical protein